MYSFNESMKEKISLRALSNSNFSKCRETFFIKGEEFRGSVFSRLYFSARAETLETRLPNLLANSSLCLLMRAFSSKSPSSPNGIALIKKYLIVSASYFFLNSKGDVTFPNDLDIFWLLTVKKPWTIIFPGNSRPADNSMPGQIPAWNLNM